MKIDEMRIRLSKGGGFMKTPRPVDKLPPRRPNEKDEHRQEHAQRIAIEGVTFLAADDERLQLFLALSGLTPTSLRAAAASPGFLLGVLEYISRDEALLLAFCEAAALDPHDIIRASEVFGGPQPEWSP